ncbi:MAG: uncharacterized protein KVP18_000356 [Porospora cf. gigantea A]|uniref:uncharacterized protein n=1 Tax=Porospora cf. gigantea A TaxID=2853593 RepID=UPI00355AC563|nr:MAG: hypothetical protein KVP18_000356 [Porospora cf. gigantea A]
MLIRQISRTETGTLLLGSLPSVVERFWTIVATKHERRDGCSCTFMLPLEDQATLNSTLLNFVRKHPIMSISDNRRVVDCIVGSPCELSDRRHLSRMLQSENMAGTLPPMLDDAHLHSPWATEWTLKQRALFARDPTACDRPWRGLLELRSLWEEFERLGKAGLYTALEMAFLEAINSPSGELEPAEVILQKNRDLTVYLSHIGRLDTSEGAYAVLAAFLGISRLLMSKNLTGEELTSAWSRLGILSAQRGLREPMKRVGGTTDTMECCKNVALRVAEVLGNDLYVGPNHVGKQGMLDIARGARIRDPDFLLDLENMEAVANDTRSRCKNDQKVQVFRTVPQAAMHDFLSAGRVVDLKEVWKMARPHMLGSLRDLLVQHTPVGKLDRVSSRNLVMRNMPLGLIKALRHMGPDGAALSLYICAIVLQQLGSILNMYYNQSVLYHGLLQTRLAGQAQKVLDFGLWSERAGQLALAVALERDDPWLENILNLMVRDSRHQTAQGTTLSDADVYVNSIIRMKTAVEEARIVLSLVDSTDWGQSAACDMRLLDEFLDVITKKVSFRQLPSPFWKINDASATSSALCIYEDAYNLAMTTKFPNQVDVGEKSYGAKTAAEQSLPTDQNIPSVVRPSSKFPIRLERGHTCASRCERFILGELTTTSIRSRLINPHNTRC